MIEIVDLHPLFFLDSRTRIMALDSGRSAMVMKQMGRQVASSGDVLMTPAEVAALFRVSPKTVARWSRAGKLTALRTLGGHRRFRVEEVKALRAEVDNRYDGEHAAT
jgi:excisionase family DNA binding protein